MIDPSTAVIMKFDEVLIMETCVVEVPRARAFVNNVHIMPLKRRFRRKNILIVCVNFCSSKAAGGMESYSAHYYFNAAFYIRQTN